MKRNQKLEKEIGKTIHSFHKRKAKPRKYSPPKVDYEPIPLGNWLLIFFVILLFAIGIYMDLLKDRREIDNKNMEDSEISMSKNRFYYTEGYTRTNQFYYPEQNKKFIITKAIYEGVFK